MVGIGIHDIRLEVQLTGLLSNPDQIDLAISLAILEI
jgi:hypothetical protein